jgi:hypothetical protein
MHEEAPMTIIPTTLRGGCAALAFAACLAIVSPAQSETISLKADLKGSNEVPPNTAKGTGFVTLTFDSASKRLSWKGTLTNLSAAPTAAHLHGPAEAGKNAGVVIAIPNPGASFEGSALLSDGQAADLLGGRIYVNIHTAAHPGGEVRGQILK